VAGKEVMRVKYDENRVDEMVLALMHLTTFREASGYRTWKGHDKVRSVDLTGEGQLRSEDLFKKHFS
jgi:hypothetical protein